MLNRLVSIIMSCMIAGAVYVAADYHQGQDLRERALSRCQNAVQEELEPVENVSVFADSVNEVNSVFVNISGHYHATFPSDEETNTPDRGTYKCSAKCKK